MKKDQQGFTAVEVLLILVIVALVGGLGWYVLGQRKSNNTTSTTTQQSAKTTTDSMYKEYVNKEFGFKFSYPTEWGAAAVINSVSVPKAGKAYNITFSKLSKINFGFVTKDYVAADTDAKTAVGFTEYNKCSKDNTGARTQIFIYTSVNSCVTVLGKKTSDSTETNPMFVAWLKMQINFSKNQKIAGLELQQAPLAIKDVRDETMFSAYGNIDVTNGFIEIAKTAQEL